MFTVRRPRSRVAAWLVAMVVIGLVALGGGYVAGSNRDPSSVNGLVTAHGGTVTQVRIAGNNDIPSTSSQTFRNVPGANLTFTVPTGQKALFDARFSATSDCIHVTNTTGGVGCLIRILVGGVEADPTGTNAQVFDSSSQDGREAHAIERFRGPLGPGTYAVVAQFAVPTAGTTFHLDSWVLQVERIKA